MNDAQKIANSIIARNIKSAFIESLAVIDLKLDRELTDKVMEILDENRK